MHVEAAILLSAEYIEHNLEKMELRRLRLLTW